MVNKIILYRVHRPPLLLTHMTVGANQQKDQRKENGKQTLNLCVEIPVEKCKKSIKFPFNFQTLEQLVSYMSKWQTKIKGKLAYAVNLGRL